ncbi:Hypothetical protein LRC_06730 [Ligilactobacillus ruminis ATCC 27782]|uniref:Uncharacterized protein n=1 Tax=Ligilactobacillus ruminis (strain ATCC 27782 / RF3) TaxID=1069534 RepID=G2SMR8_LIGR2|nr:Hypothetical protein LRC_06730 [Ligilactobacillus ruminis ATCC 27782]
MQRLINQRDKLFLVIFITEGNRPAYAKNRIRFAIDCKSSGFSI